VLAVLVIAVVTSSAARICQKSVTNFPRRPPTLTFAPTGERPNNMPQDLPRRRLPPKSIKEKRNTMGTVIFLLFLAMFAGAVWFVARSIRKSWRPRNLQLKDLEARAQERDAV
jgi:hypothetical protein